MDWEKSFYIALLAAIGAILIGAQFIMHSGV